MEELRGFVNKWKSHFQAMEAGPSRPQNGNQPLILAECNAPPELRSFIGLYICRNRKRRYWFESECGISFLFSGDNRQLCLQFETNGIAKESSVDMEKFKPPLFSLGVPWRDAIKTEPRKCGEDDDTCSICLDVSTFH